MTKKRPPLQGSMQSVVVGTEVIDSFVIEEIEEQERPAPSRAGPLSSLTAYLGCANDDDDIGGSQGATKPAAASSRRTKPSATTIKRTTTVSKKTSPAFPVGTKVCYKFDDGKYYAWKVSKFTSNKYSILYDDGDKETCTENEVRSGAKLWESHFGSAKKVKPPPSRLSRKHFKLSAVR